MMAPQGWPNRRAAALGDVESVADVTAVSVRQHDVADAVDGRRAVRDESRVASEERIQQDRLTGEIEAKGGMPIPDDLHASDAVVDANIVRRRGRGKMSLAAAHERASRAPCRFLRSRTPLNCCQRAVR